MAIQIKDHADPFMTQLSLTSALFDSIVELSADSLVGTAQVPSDLSDNLHKPLSPSRQKLVELLNGLPSQQLTEIGALMLIGRAPHLYTGPTGFQRALKEFTAHYQGPLASILESKPLFKVLPRARENFESLACSLAN